MSENVIPIGKKILELRKLRGLTQSELAGGRITRNMLSLIENGTLQQYADPMTIYNMPENTFVADFVGNPAVNFVNARGTQQEEGSLILDLPENHQAVFTPNEPVDAKNWFADAEIRYAEMSHKERLVEKTNQDKLFRYPVAKLTDDGATEKEPDQDDWVLGIRPEFIRVSDDGVVDADFTEA